MIRTKATNKRLRDEIQNNRERIISAFGNKCLFCSQSNSEILEVHHILPLSEGGTNDLYNLSILCPNCHGAVHEYIKPTNSNRVSFMLRYISSTPNIDGKKVVDLLNRYADLGIRKEKENNMSSVWCKHE